MNDINKTETAMFAAKKWSVETGNVNINWNQNGSHEQSVSRV